MASIDKLASGKHRVRYRTPDGDSRSKTFDTAKAARAFKTSVEHKVLSGEYVDAAAGKITFRDYAEQWRRDQAHHRASTAELVESRLRVHAYPAFGERALSSVTRSLVQGWVSERARVLAPSTLEVVYGIVRSVFAAAVEDGRLSRTPCRKIKLPTVEKPDVTPIDMDNVRRLHDGMPDRLGAMVTVGAGLGLRAGEAAGLTLDRINFLRKTVTVDQQLNLKTGQLAPPKTQCSRRTVPLADPVAAELSAHLAEFGAGRYGLLFRGARGAPLRPHTFYDTWGAAVASAGMEGTRFHDLRHTYASTLLSAGVSVVAVAEYMGHQSATVTLDTYGHLMPADVDRAQAAVADAFASGDTDPGRVMGG